MSSQKDNRIYEEDLLDRRSISAHEAKCLYHGLDPQSTSNTTLEFLDRGLDPASTIVYEQELVIANNMIF